MADDVLLTNIKLEGADQVQDDLKKIGEEGARAFDRLSQAANQRFDQVSQALTKVSTSLDRFANTRVEINTDRANQALENIAKVTDQLSRQLANLGQPGARSLQEFNATAQRTQGEVRALEGATTSAFNNIGQSGASAFTLIKNTISDAISTAQNYKALIAGIFTGGAVGFVVKGIQDAVKDFNDLKKAASDAKVGFDDYQRINFVLREIGVSAADAARVLNDLGKQAEDLKRKGGISSTARDIHGDLVRTTKTFEFVGTGDEKAVRSTGTIVENLTKIDEINRRFKAGLFGDPASLDAIEKHRAALDHLRKETAAATAGPQTLSRAAQSALQIDEAIEQERLRRRIRAGAFGDQNTLAGMRRALEAEADLREEFRRKAERGGKPQTIQVSDFFPDRGLQEANKALKEFQTKPTADGLRTIANEAGKIADEAKRLDFLKQAFGGAEGPAKAVAAAIKDSAAAFDDLTLKGSGLDRIFANYQKLVQIKKEDEKNTEALTAANEKLNQALFEVGFATTQGRINLGLTFAPILAPAIDAIATAISGLNLKFRETTKAIGSDIGPAITQLFNIFKEGGEKFVPLVGGEGGNMFAGFVNTLKAVADFVRPILREITTAVGDFFTFLGEQGAQLDTSSLGERFAGFIRDAVNGFKLLTAVAKPALAIVNEFFGTNVTLGDVGLVAILTQIGGGFTAIGLLAAAAFGQSSEASNKLKENLKKIGVDFDEIIRKIKVFGTAVLESIGRIGTGKKLDIGADDADKEVKKLADEFVSLGEIVVTVGGFLLTFRRTMTAVAAAAGLEKLTGVFTTLKPVLEAAAFSILAINGALRILITLLGWPVVLVAGLILVAQHADIAKLAFDGLVTAINTLFGIKLTGFEVLAGIIALVVLRIGFALRALGLFSTALVTAEAAAGTVAAGGFAALLATLGRVALRIGIIVGLVELFQATVAGFDKAGIGTKITTQQQVNEIADLNEKNRRDRGALRAAATDEEKAEVQKRIDARNARLSELKAPGTEGAKAADAPEVKSATDKITTIWEEMWKKWNDITDKGVGSINDKMGKVGEPVKSKGGQTPEDIAKLRQNLGPDESVVQVGGKFYRVKNEGTTGTTGTTQGLPTPAGGAPLGPDETLVKVGDKVYRIKNDPPIQLPEIKVGPRSSLEGLTRFASLQTGTMSDAVVDGPPAQKALTATTQNLNSADTDLLRTTKSLVDSDGSRLDLTRQSVGAASVQRQAFTGLTGVTQALDQTNQIYDGTVNVLDGSANRLRETFDKLTVAVLRVIEELKKIKVPEGEEKLKSDAPQGGGTEAGFTTKTYQVADPSAPGGTRTVTVRTPTAQAPATGGRTPTAPGQQGGGRTATLGDPGIKLVPPGTINPATGLPFPSGTMVVDPLTAAVPGGAFLAPGAINPNTGQPFPAGTMFASPGGVDVKPPANESGEAKTPGVPVPYRTEPADPNDPNSKQIPIYRAPRPGTLVPQQQPPSVVPQQVTPQTAPLGPNETEVTVNGRRYRVPKEGGPTAPTIVPIPTPRPSTAPSGAIQDQTQTPIIIPVTPQLVTPEGVPADRGFLDNIIQPDDPIKIPVTPEPLPLTTPPDLPKEFQPEPPPPPTPPTPAPDLDDPNLRVAALTQSINDLAAAAQPASAALEEFTVAAQSVPADVQQVEQSFDQIDFAQAEQAITQFVQEVNQTMERLSGPQMGGGSAAAAGGLIRGPGTDTSNSIPILASANEFMMRAKAVRHYGKDFMYAVNNMQFPHFAMGGLLDNITSPLSGNIRLPRYADGGPIQGGESHVPVHVNFEGRRVFSGHAPRSSIEQLKRESLLSKVRSGGPSPFWVD